MPIDPRIALQAIGIQAPDVLGAMAQGQQYRQNQMAAQRRADALAAAQNYMRAPAAVAAPAMQPGSSGPAIAGAPLPAVNAMGPAPVQAVASPRSSSLPGTTVPSTRLSQRTSAKGLPPPPLSSTRASKTPPTSSGGRIRKVCSSKAH